jgi:sirohydrochlorin cobaltochelatase
MNETRKRTAVVFVSFGSSSQGQKVLDSVIEQIKDSLRGYEVFQAWTSEVLCRKCGRPGLHTILENVKDAGFAEVFVQPLHMFPGTEYEKVVSICSSFRGLDIVVGEALMHRWRFVRDILGIVSKDFLPPDKGLNLLAMHGSVLASDPVNSMCLGIADTVSNLYPNVKAASIEGIPDSKALFARLHRENYVLKYSKVRIVPLMLVAGRHVERDLLGARNSWKSELINIGFTDVDTPVIYKDKKVLKGVACYPEFLEYVICRLRKICIE